MTRPTLLKPLALAALALLAASPTSARAAKRQKTAFSIVIEAVARLEQFPTLPPEYDIDFRASGAIKDSGPVGAGSNNWSELWGKHATYVVFITGADTFEIWQPTDGSWPGTLLGSGTFTYEESYTGWWHRIRYELDGTLVGE